MASLKGKEKVIEGNSGKRKNNSAYDDKTGDSNKRRNRSVLQFFEVDGDTNDYEDDFYVNDFLEDKFPNEYVKLPLVPFIKEEEMELDDEELERMVEERYGRGSSFVRYAEDGDQDECLPLLKDPTLWKVKCMVGREKLSVFCLMQKYVDLGTSGTKLQIISAFSLDHVNGFIYIEAESQQDLYEACKGLSTIYVGKVAPVPPNERSYVLSVRSKGCGITAGMWARVKRGKYKGDLGQIVAINEARKKATVKLIPRIDLRALAEKFGGGVSGKRTSAATPPRLISSSELEEFRPLIQIRRDRDTNKTFEVLDGMMLKDGYLYKKITIDSLSVWGGMPTDDELLKFEPANNNEFMDLEFLYDLYGTANRKKKEIMKNDKAVEKGDGSLTSNVEHSFEVHDLVFFGKKDFGVIIGMENDNNFKIMKEGTEGPLLLTLPARDLKSASFDKKLFTSQDVNLKKISVNDRVRVMDGPSKDKEGVVKHIYRGIIFLFNEIEEDHNGYTCFKSQICEKLISAGEASHEQGNETGPSGFGESPSSPNSTLPTKKSWQGRENSSFNQEDKNAMFSVGQSLRIKMGPLKGYLCRALAIRRSDVTVKLDSQNKILTVKSEHLSEARGWSSASVTGGDQESANPFDLLGTTDGSRGSSWNKDGGSNLSKPAGGSAWDLQACAKAEEPHNTSDQPQSWGKKGGGSWNKHNGGSSWGKPAGISSWGQHSDTNAKARNDESVDGQGGNNHPAAKPSDGSSSGWKMKSKPFNKTQSSAWGNSSSWNQNAAGNSTNLKKRDQSDSWDVKKASDGGSSTGWGKGNWGKSSTDDASGNQKSAWSNKSDWGAGNDCNGRQEQVDNFSRGGGRGESGRGGFGGRGGSSRGGFRGRGGSFGGRDKSERGGYGGRGRSDRGGFRGRGRSAQGGFGGRGRGRSDQYGGAVSRQQKGWSSGSQSNGGMDGADGGGGQKSWSSRGSWSKPGNNGGWNQGSTSGYGKKDGADGGQKKSWSSGGSRSKPGNNAGWNKGSTFGSGNNDGDGGQRKNWGSGGNWSKPANNSGWNKGSAPGSGKKSF